MRGLLEHKTEEVVIRHPALQIIGPGQPQMPPSPSRLRVLSTGPEVTPYRGSGARGKAVNWY